MNSLAVVIATVDRPHSLTRLFDALQRQTLRPTQIVVCVPDQDALPTSAGIADLATVVPGVRGASAQRNAGVDALVRDTDVVVMFDDDAIPREDYLERVQAHFHEDVSLVALTGSVVVDGVREGRALPEAVMLNALDESWRRPVRTEEPTGGARLYGCNMAVRYRALSIVRFDEALPLYSWLEDLDLSRRLEQFGSIKQFADCVAAHEGHQSSGRENHLRFGYSSVMNPVYLTRKGSLRWHESVALIARPLLANLRAGPLSARRRDRLRGMALALSDVMRGRFTPERILTLPATARHAKARRKALTER